MLNGNLMPEIANFLISETCRVEAAEAVQEAAVQLEWIVRMCYPKTVCLPALPCPASPCRLSMGAKWHIQLFAYLICSQQSYVSLSLSLSHSCHTLRIRILHVCTELSSLEICTASFTWNHLLAAIESMMRKCFSLKSIRLINAALITSWLSLLKNCN